MSFKLSDILTGGVSSLVDKAVDIFDDLHISKEEKAEISLKLREAAIKEQESMGRLIQARFDVVTKVIQAEMAQGDSYTKRARPSVVYFGLLMFGAQILAQFWNITINVPQDFVVAWTGVVGIWMVGRSAEKYAGVKSWTAPITGNKKTDLEL